jgi:hypothetical protein
MLTVVCWLTVHDAPILRIPMPIRIKCPKCQTVLGVKESLAGKKANCPKCRYMLTIPVLKPAPAAATVEDADALALSAFADQPPKEAPVSTKTIEFACPFCSETVKVSADLAGKQAPCPNPDCKRIVKVPLLKEDKPKDWRQMSPRGPTGAIRQDENQPEGAWSTAQKTHVSKDALLEADAIPVKKEPVTVAAWIRRGVVVAVLFVALIGGAMGFFSWMANNRLWGPFNSALAAESKLPPAHAAVLQMGAGEFYLLRGDSSKGADYFRNAYAKFPMPEDKTQPDAERDAVLIALMFVLIDNGAETESPSQLDWSTVKKELERALIRLSSAEAKQSALRDVSSRLIAAKQSEIALKLAEQMVPPPPPEQAPPQEQVEPEEGAPKPQPNKAKQKSHVPPPLGAQQIALLYFLGGKDHTDKAHALAHEPDPKAGDFGIVARLAYAEGNARKNQYEAAQKIARASGNELHRFEASLAVAAIAQTDKKSAEAKTNAEDAWKSFTDLQKTTSKIPVWLLIQLTRACARGDMANQAKQVIEAIPEKEKGARAVAQLELLQVQLEATPGAVPMTLVDEYLPSKDTVAYAMTLQRIAHHNTRLGQRSESMTLVDSMDETNRPFVQMGVALGMVDPRK